MFEIVLLGGMAVFMIYYGLRPVMQQTALRSRAKTVSALVENVGHDRKGAYFTFRYTENGIAHFVQYPYHAKKAPFQVGDTVTLYIDPEHSEKVLLKGDSNSYGTTAFCLVCAGLLLALLFYLLR